MINVNLLYQSVRSQSNTDISGWIDDEDFNSFLRLSELSLIEFLTGKVNEPPMPLLTKNIDWLEPFIKNTKGNFKSEIPLIPEYYHFNQLRVKNESGIFQSAEIMTPAQARNREQSYIEEIRNDFVGYIESGKIKMNNQLESEFEFIFYRYPVFGKYVSKLNTLHNEEVYDDTESKNLEWPPIAEPYFVFKINMYINKRNREIVAAQLNQP